MSKFLHDVMIIAPHPDDAEIAMGGTIAALIQQGVKIVLVDLTDGEPTPYGSSEIRAQETKDASSILGITTRVQLGLKNREIYDSVENRKKLANIIREYRPRILFAPYWEDAHPDHIEACKLVESARFYSKFVKSDLLYEPVHPQKLFHFFSTHIRVRFHPTFTFNISDHMDKKLDALKSYKSQFLLNEKNAGVLEMIQSQNRYWGAESGCKYAEPFLCREAISIQSFSAITEMLPTN